jgi:hypothetical protein
MFFDDYPDIKLEEFDNVKNKGKVGTTIRYRVVI